MIDRVHFVFLSDRSTWLINSTCRTLRYFETIAEAGHARKESYLSPAARRLVELLRTRGKELFGEGKASGRTPTTR